MAYTRAWSNLAPLGSVAANQIDDEFRKFRVDTQERMDTVLGAGKWATDPIAAMSGLKMFLHGSLSSNGGEVGATFQTNAIGKYITPPAGLTASITIPVRVPIGCTLTEVLAYINNNGVTSTGITFYKVSTTGTQTAIGASGSTGAAGNQSIGTGAIAEVVADALSYAAQIVVSDPGGGTSFAIIYCVRVTYTKVNIIE